MEDTTHYLWPSIRGDVFLYVPCGTEASHDGDQVLAIKLTLWGWHKRFPSHESVRNQEEIVAM
jgi:hypothetical protein